MGKRQIKDDFGWVKGRHGFKFGFDGWSAISPTSFTQRSRGDYEWNFLSDYLFDTNPDGIAQRSFGNNTYYQNQKLLGFYGKGTANVRVTYLARADGPVNAPQDTTTATAVATSAPIRAASFT